MSVVFEKTNVSRLKRFRNFVKRTSGLLLWLSADTIPGVANGDPIASWPDQSGNGLNAAGSGTVAPALILAALNNKPIVRFSGSNGFQLGVGTEASFDLAAYTLIAVAKKASGSGATIFAKNNLVADATRRKMQMTINAALGLAGGNDGASITQAATTTNWNLLMAVVRTNTDADLVINGTVTNKTDTLDHTTFNNAQAEIGQAFGNGSERLVGDIAEIILYSRALSLAEHVKIKQYLALKYGLTVS